MDSFRHFKVQKSKAYKVYKSDQQEENLLDNLLSTKPDRNYDQQEIHASQFDQKANNSHQILMQDRQNHAVDKRKNKKIAKKKCPTKNYPKLLSRRIKKVIANHIIPILLQGKTNICGKAKETYYPTTQFWNNRKAMETNDDYFLLFCVQFTQNKKNSLKYLSLYLKGQPKREKNHQKTYKIKVKLDSSKGSYGTDQIQQADILTFNNKLKSWILEKEEVMLEQCRKDNSKSYADSELKTQDLCIFARKWLNRLKI